MATRAAGRHEFLRISLPCDQSCLFCSIVVSAEDEEGSASAVREKIAAMGEDVAYLTLTGGEPTRNPRFLEYARLAAEVGIGALMIESNAKRFAEPEFLAAVEAAHPHVEVFASLHSHRADVSDLITQDPGGHALSVQGIGALLDAGARVSINHVLTRLNAAELVDFIDFVADTFPGTRHVTLSFVAPVGRAASHAWIVPALRDARPFLRAGVERALERGVRVTIPDRCGVPPCVIPEHADLHDALSGDAPAEVTRGPDRHVAEDCGSCAIEGRCLGVWSAYAEVHGDESLRPLRSDGRGGWLTEGEEQPPAQELQPLLTVSVDGTGLSETDRAAYVAGERRLELDRIFVDAAFHEERESYGKALQRASQLLALEPRDERALALFDRVVNHTHVAEARKRLARGDRAGARKILRWVLAHRREHPEARRAWNEL